MDHLETPINITLPPGMDPCILGFTNGTYPNGTKGLGNFKFGHYNPADPEWELCQLHNDYYYNQTKYGLYTTYFLVVAFALAGFFHAFNWLDSYGRLRGSSFGIKMLRVPRAAWRALSYGQIHSYLPTNGTALFLAIAWSFMSAYCWGIRPYYRPPNYGSSPLGLRSEFIATALVPWIYLLPMKHNVLRSLTRLTIETAQTLHKWFGWFCLFFSLVHTIAQTIRALRQAPWTYTYAHNVYYRTGFAALGPLTWLCFLSIPWVRHRFYETFYILHLVGALLFVVFMYLHLDNDLGSWSYMHATVVLWGSALGYRLLLVAHNGLHAPRAVVKPLDESTTLVEIPTKSGFKWSAGQFYWIRFFSIRPLSSHPFTVASLPTDGHLAFIVRTMSGFTKRLPNSKVTAPSRVWLDGPYGTVATKNFYACSSVLFVAGGSGATFVVPLMIDIIQKKKAEQSLCQKIHLVWTAKCQTEFTWYLPQLRALLEDGDDVEVSLHITQSQEEHDIGADTKVVDTQWVPAVGRPNIESLVHGQANTVAGKTGIVVCGPEGMVIDTRNAVAGVQLDVLSRRVLADEVELISELFTL
ncbi:ferric reductase like transmembrane component-domain-containing protein [Gymnopilus junonius]|uniref:ferric-chelate reductase (NADPH) n=1 Tax=Gymnopilus junonius TaxID=109634 RepID=A0A9P5NYF9_GYMJU|nr:ferric reductase like transmembrane component-domain-containing protein [Gymnopilus junonius]